MGVRGDRKEASSAAKFRLLTWKNFLLQWRHPKQMVAELLVPVLAMSLILIVRTEIEPSTEAQTDFAPVPADSLEWSLTVLAGMNITRMSIAYSPENPVLEEIIRTSVANLLAKNLPRIIDMLPPEVIEMIPPGLVNMTQVEEALLGMMVNVDAYNRSADLRGIYYNEEVTRLVLAAVEFPDEYRDVTDLRDRNVSYALRFPEKPRLHSFFLQGGRSWRTSLLFPGFPLPGPRFQFSWIGGNDPGYVNEMFIALQHSISTALISWISGQEVDYDVTLQRYPHPAYTRDLIVQALQMLFPFFVMLSFSYTAVNIARAVTLEKELQLKEAMKIMGLPSWLHWSAWFFKQFVFILIAIILVVLLLKIDWFTTEAGITGYAVFTNTPWTVLTFFLIIYFVGVITLCFMVSSFFSKASTAALFMGVIWFVLFIPATLLSMEDSVSLFAQVCTCLSINSAMAYGFHTMLAAESVGGLQWPHFFNPPSADSSRLLFGHVVIIVLFDAVLYMLVALYMEQVSPGPFGTPRPWYFPFEKEFWCGSYQGVVDVPIEDNEVDDVVKEDEPTDLSVGVKISNLTKVYGTNTAVNNLSMNIYNDQITVLLGHNGAGKSTTISMLTGNTSSTSGSIWLAGYSLGRQLRSARAQIGLCPQHNVLFTELTVAEHLQFFARLKGLRGQRVDEEVESLVQKLELQEKRDYQASGLSGGQKRRLSVGIALCGGARVVLLDEPTSGMDPASRRALWDLLQKEKHGRSMILTTHFMDEADYLGDRIAIMAGGRLQCIGSPYFLKKQYGVGYVLVVVKQADFNIDLCTKLIGKYIEGITVKEDRGTEVAYILSTEYSHLFEHILADLEDNRAQVGYSYYGLTATSIEDVFLSVGSDVAVQDSSDMDHDGHTSDSTSDDLFRAFSDANSTEYLDGMLTVSGYRRWLQQTYAIWLKLWLVWTRSWGLLLLQILVPIVLVNMTFLFMRLVISSTDNLRDRPLTLTEGFTQTMTYVGFNGTAPPAAFDAYSTMFDDDTRLLTRVPPGQAVDHYYLEKSTNPVELATMRTEVLIGATFSSDAATAWFSNFGYHDVAISLATLHNALLKSVAPNAELNVSNHPLEVNYENSSDIQVVVLTLSMQLANAVGNAISIINAVFIMFYIKERVSRAKLLQKAAGIEPLVMWGSAAVFDWLWFLLVCLTILLSCVAFQVEGMSTGDELGRFFLFLMVYGAAMLPLTYLLSYLFDGPAFGFVVLYFINCLLGMMGAQITEGLKSLPTIEPLVTDIMDYILQFFPLYSLVTGVRAMHQISLTEWSCLQACDFVINLPGVTECNMQVMCQQNPAACCGRESPYFEWESPGSLRYIVCMLASGAVCWLLLMFIEYRVIQRVLTRRSTPPPLDEASLDDDVVNEIRHVEYIGDSAAEQRQHNLVANKLTKYYGKNLAVDQVSFTVGETECFGLLGVNGAGKTTTFKMLMGDEMMSSGDAFVRGHSVAKNIKKVHEHIGYCPQFDAVFNELTGRETLRLFALLRGLRAGTTDALADTLAASLGLTPHMDKRVFEYSGGNKRKLSAAVALMGYARLIFLDEPTTGVDPAARRQVWRAIRRAAQSGRGVVLTSHSMEECEALCSRLTIMVNGQFQCLGSPQHLKNKFSQGFTLTIKLKVSEEDALAETNAVKDYVNTHFTTPKLMEEYQGLLTYYLPSREMAWSRMFGAMERALRDLRVEGYDISQTTLEQIFLQLTKYQREAGGA